MKLKDTLLTLGKVAIKSRPLGKRRKSPCRESLIIMGNGPSLRQTLDTKMETLKSSDTMAVNFAAITDEFFTVRPAHYLLADPHFFSPEGSDTNVDKLWESLNHVEWPMTLHIPTGRRVPTLSPNITIKLFNMTPGAGWSSIVYPLFRSGMAMPRPRNVMIPAIMQGIREGYRKIYLVGADHTWPHSLYVDDDNRVVTVQPHFYKENRKELDRIAAVYAGVRLHEVLGSMTVAFRSYHDVKHFAEHEGVEVYNSTPDSLIDAFPRRPLPEL